MDITDLRELEATFEKQKDSLLKKFEPLHQKRRQFVTHFDLNHQMIIKDI